MSENFDDADEGKKEENIQDNKQPILEMIK